MSAGRLEDKWSIWDDDFEFLSGLQNSTQRERREEKENNCFDGWGCCSIVIDHRASEEALASNYSASVDVLENPPRGFG